MKTLRMRRLIGIMSLVAIGLSFGEAVAASICASTADGGGAVVVVPSSHDEMWRAVSNFMDGPASTVMDSGMEGSHGCPFIVIMGPGCTAACSLPAMASVVLADSTSRDCGPLINASPRVLLLTRAQFHPPRA